MNSESKIETRATNVFHGYPSEKRNNPRWKFCRRIFSEFCGHASVDGIQYITERNRHWIEKTFWTIVIVLAFLFGSSMVYNTYKDWQDSPVIVSFSQKSTPVSKIPFPAVTICPQQKSYSHLFNYTETYHKFKDCIDKKTVCNVSETDEKRFIAFAQICDYEHIIHLLPELKNFRKRIDVISEIMELAPEMESAIFTCDWLNDERCDKLFHTSITDQGICFTFNSMNYEDMFRENNILSKYNFTSSPTSNWTIEHGYDKNMKVDEFPYRVFGSGSDAGLHITLHAEERNFDYICKSSVQGFNVQIHAPNNFPQLNKIYFRVPIDQEVIIVAQPQMMITANSLRSYDPKIRQCFFSDERYLRYFRIYTQNNCEMECVANYTLEKCGCVKFSIPVTADIQICTAADRQCYYNAEREVLVREFKESSKENPESEEVCNCLPACTSLSYTTDTTQGAINREYVLRAKKQESLIKKGDHKSALKIFFKQNNFHMSRRSELYRMTDFIANCGGLLGLFLGVSAISIIEIFYFCTLRLIGNKLR